jgi:hypothetical protein
MLCYWLAEWTHHTSLGCSLPRFYHSTPPHLFYSMYYWEFMQEGGVQRKIRINTFKNWSRSLLFLCVFLFDQAIFGNLCRSGSSTVWVSSSENSSYTFFYHDTDCHFITGYTEPYTPPSTHSSQLYTKHFGKHPISEMFDLWVIYWE